MPDHTHHTDRPRAARDEQVPSLTFAAPRGGGRHGRPTHHGQDGSLVSEYGLIAVLGATITGVAISWAKGGAIATLLNVILKQVRALAGV